MIYTFLRNYHLTIDEYYDLAAIGLCKAAMNFNESKSLFSTYAYKAMLSQILTDKRKERAKSTIPDNKIMYYQAEMENKDGNTAEYINYIPAKENTEGEAICNVLLEKCKSKLNDKDKKILILFSKGYKQREIGKIVGYSQSQISRVKKRLAQYLTN